MYFDPCNPSIPVVPLPPCPLPSLPRGKRCVKLHLLRLAQKLRLDLLVHRAKEVDVGELLVVGVLDEHVRELDLRAVDVLSRDENWQPSTSTLGFEQRKDVAELRRESRRENGEGRLTDSKSQSPGR